MRAIEFRGQLLDSNKWVYGGFFVSNGQAMIVEDTRPMPTFHRVKKETVGQFTGLYDSTNWGDATGEQQQYAVDACTSANYAKIKTDDLLSSPSDFWKGVKIFEGDILQVYENNEKSFKSVVKYFIEQGYPAFELEPLPFLLDYNALQYYADVKDCGEEVKIIDNIHDNSELLND